MGDAATDLAAVGKYVCRDVQEGTGGQPLAITLSTLFALYILGVLCISSQSLRKRALYEPCRMTSSQEADS